MNNYIFDASIVINSLTSPDKKFYREIKKILKRAKQNKDSIWAPDIFLYEVANGLRFAGLPEEKLIKFWRKFSRLPIQYFNLGPEKFSMILKMANRFNTTVYDSSYHYLAILLEGVFYTKDRQYYKRVKELGSIKLF